MPSPFKQMKTANTSEDNQSRSGRGFVVYGEEDESYNGNSSSYAVIGEEQEELSAVVTNIQPPKPIQHSGIKGTLVEGEEDESNEHPLAKRSMRFYDQLRGVVIQRPNSSLKVETSSVQTLADAVNQDLEPPRDPQFSRSFFNRIAQTKISTINDQGELKIAQPITIAEQISEPQNSKSLSIFARIANFCKTQLQNIKNWYSERRAPVLEKRDEKPKQLSSFAKLVSSSSINVSPEDFHIVGSGHLFTPAPREAYFSNLPRSSKSQADNRQQHTSTIRK